MFKCFVGTGCLLVNGSEKGRQRHAVLRISDDTVIRIFVVAYLRGRARDTTTEHAHLRLVHRNRRCDRDAGRLQRAPAAAASIGANVFAKATRAYARDGLAERAIDHRLFGRAIIRAIYTGQPNRQVKRRARPARRRRAREWRRGCARQL